MSSEKEALRFSVLNEVGNEFDDQLEAITAEANRAAGAVVGAVKSSQAVEQLCAVVGRDRESGELQKEWEQLIISDSPVVSLARLLTLWLTRAVVAVDGVRQRSEGEHLIQQGRKDAMQRVIAQLKKKADSTRAKHDRLKVQEVATLYGEPVVMEEPSRRIPIKERRIKEEQAETPNGADTGS